MNSGYLLGNIPDSSIVGKVYQPVRGGDVVEGSLFLVPEEHIWSPYLVPHIVFQFYFLICASIIRSELQPGVNPLLS